MIWRRVVRREPMKALSNRRGAGVIKHTMECGHFEFGNKSAGQPKRKRCRDCEDYGRLAAS